MGRTFSTSSRKRSDRMLGRRSGSCWTTCPRTPRQTFWPGWKRTRTSLSTSRRSARHGSTKSKPGLESSPARRSGGEPSPRCAPSSRRSPTTSTAGTPTQGPSHGLQLPMRSSPKLKSWRRTSASWLTTTPSKAPAITTLATRAVAAANAQRIALPGEALAAQLAAQLAEGVIALDEQIKHIDKLIEGRFHHYHAAPVILRMPGIGVLLGAEFLAATGGDTAACATPDRLAGYAGLAPAPRDSGRISGNLHRPKRYNRQLQRVFYTSALISIRCCPESRTFYDRKRAAGKRHNQAVLALARRRVNVLWALLRDHRPYQAGPPTSTAAAA